MRLLDDLCQQSLYTVYMKSEKDAESITFVATKEIGVRIATIRKGKGLTQADLAEKVGISRLLISDYERGKVRIYADILAKISTALGISSDTLLEVKNAKNEKYIPNLKIAKRLKALERLPEIKQKAILKTLDDLIRANQ